MTNEKRVGYVIASLFDNGKETYYSESLNGDWSFEEDIRLAHMFDSYWDAEGRMREELGYDYEVFEVEYEFKILSKINMKSGPQAQ